MGRFSVGYIAIDNANRSKDDAGGSISVVCTKLREQLGRAFIVNVGPVGDGRAFADLRSFLQGRAESAFSTRDISITSSPSKSVRGRPTVKRGSPSMRSSSPTSSSRSRSDPTPSASARASRRDTGETTSNAPRRSIWRLLRLQRYNPRKTAKNGQCLPLQTALMLRLEKR